MLPVRTRSPAFPHRYPAVRKRCHSQKLQPLRANRQTGRVHQEYPTDRHGFPPVGYTSATLAPPRCAECCRFAGPMIPFVRWFSAVNTSIERPARFVRVLKTAPANPRRSSQPTLSQHSSQPLRRWYAVAARQHHVLVPVGSVTFVYKFQLPTALDRIVIGQVPVARARPAATAIGRLGSAHPQRTTEVRH